MAKKRKEIKIIELSAKIEDISIGTTTKPKCFGSKSKYCLRELCGQWFDQCLPDPSSNLEE